jgi:hypothetical protein
VNRPHALRVRTRLARKPVEPPAETRTTDAPPAVPAAAPAPIGGRRARGAARPAQAQRTGYDDLSTEQVIAHISRLTPPELEVLATHEREHQNRAEIIARIAVFRGHSTPSEEDE